MEKINQGYTDLFAMLNGDKLKAILQGTRGHCVASLGEPGTNITWPSIPPCSSSGSVPSTQPDGNTIPTGSACSASAGSISADVDGVPIICYILLFHPRCLNMLASYLYYSFSYSNYTDKTSLRLIRRIGGWVKGPHWIDIGLTLDSHWIHW